MLLFLVLLAVEKVATATKASLEIATAFALHQKVARALGTATTEKNGTIVDQPMDVKLLVNLICQTCSALPCAFQNASVKKEMSEMQMEIAFRKNRVQLVKLFYN